MKPRHILYAVVGALIASPVAALAFVKPLRVAAPALMPGITCTSASICIDDTAALGNAQALYREGYEKAAAAVGPFQGSPRVVFCVTQACAETFGMGRRAGAAILDFGLVVAPRGWKPYYLAHEMIHYRQAETLGRLAMVTKPTWLIEGMAYSLSGDPRLSLGQPLDQWRSQFDTWRAGIGSRDLWEAARDAH